MDKNAGPFFHRQLPRYLQTKEDSTLTDELVVLDSGAPGTNFSLNSAFLPNVSSPFLLPRLQGALVEKGRLEHFDLI